MLFEYLINTLRLQIYEYFSNYKGEYTKSGGKTHQKCLFFNVELHCHVPDNQALGITPD